MESILFLEEVISTNSTLKELANQNKLTDGFIVAANFQTLGRGQVGNSWESEAGKNLSFSIILHPQFIEASSQFIISQIVSLAIKEVLDSYTKHISIKWPNDIYWKEKKICGILIENDLMDTTIYRSIIGIGLNINQTLFLSNAPNPISLKQILDQDIDREIIIRQIQKAIIENYTKLKSGIVSEFGDRYKASLYRNTGYYKFKDHQGYFDAKIKDIDPLGRLVLEDKEENTRYYNFKEVSYVN